MIYAQRRKFLLASASLLLPSGALARLHGGKPSLTATYEGFIAQRPRQLTSLTTTNKQMNTRSACIATDSITSLKIVVSNFYVPVSPPSEIGPGAASTVTASVEYPAGTFTQILFGGVASGSVPDAGIKISDYCNVTIPNGETFWIRTFINNTGGLVYNAWGNISLGDGLESAVSGLTDKTLSGTITPAAFTSPPLAVIGFTTKPSVLVLGDSIAFGYTSAGPSDDTAALDGRMGIVSASFPTTLGFANIAAPGGEAHNFSTQWAARKALLAYGSHLVCALGVNDIEQLGNSAATLLADLQAIWAQAPATTKIAQTTLTPKSSSTDSWATTANQTTAATNSVLQSFNATIRAGGITGLSNGYFEVAHVLEPVANDGLWINPVSPGGGPYTADGLHPLKVGYDYVAASGAIDLSRITYP